MIVWQGGCETVPTLADQVHQLDQFITKILSSHVQSLTNPTEISRPNLNLEETRFQVENLDILNLEESRNIIVEQNRALAQLRYVYHSGLIVFLTYLRNMLFPH